jgi:hypothetical protein
MARRPPSQVRSHLRSKPRPWTPDHPQVVRGISAPAQRQIAEFEHRIGVPGAVAFAVTGWGRQARSPGNAHTSVEGFGVFPDFQGETPQSRSLLEIALRTLPSGAARELRAVVTPLDEMYLARVTPDPRIDDLAWWRYIA